MEKRDSMVFYRSFYEAIKELSKEQQGEIYNAIFSYGLDFIEPSLSGVSKTVWTLIKPQIDANIRRYSNGKQPKIKQNRSKTEAKQKQETSKTEANVNDNVNVNVNDNVKNNIKDNKGVPPPFIDFISHCREKAKQMNLTIDEDLIRTKFDAWIEGDWKDMNGKKILNWKAKISSNITYWQKKQEKKADTNFLRVYT